MNCFYTVDGKGPVYYFDGNEAHPLSCQVITGCCKKEINTKIHIVRK